MGVGMAWKPGVENVKENGPTAWDQVLACSLGTGLLQVTSTEPLLVPDAASESQRSTERLEPLSGPADSDFSSVAAATAAGRSAAKYPGRAPWMAHSRWRTRNALGQMMRNLMPWAATAGHLRPTGRKDRPGPGGGVGGSEWAATQLRALSRVRLALAGRTLAAKLP